MNNIMEQMDTQYDYLDIIYYNNIGNPYVLYVSIITKLELLNDIKDMHKCKT